jgi:hypothetical protein
MFYRRLASYGLSLLVLVSLSSLFVPLFTQGHVQAASDTYAYCSSTTDCGNESSEGDISDTGGGSSFNLSETSIAGNTVVWSIGGATDESITVDICTPDTGTLNDSGTKSTVHISGNYANMVNYDSLSLPLCNTSTTYSKQTVTVNVTVNDIPQPTSGTTTTLGPVDLVLEDSTGNSVQTTQAAADPNVESGQDQLQGVFPTAVAPPATAVAAATVVYKVCSTELNPQPNCASITEGDFVGSITVTLTGTPNASIVHNNGGAGDGTPSCESSGGPLSWIFCAAVDEIAKAETALEGVVDSMLKTQPIDFSTSDPTHIYTVWSNFRIYGNIVLVIALLVIVFGEVIGGGVVDAYTAKKMLPRILIAAILINLSIYIVAALEDITNIVGTGLDALIRQPFEAAGAWKVSVGAGVGNIGFAGLVAAGSALWIGGGEAAAAIALFVGLPVLLAIVGILVTLILRQGILVFLVIISPVAFALYCLPNTESIFKKWWDLLFKTLLVYPIVSVVFAMANVTAVIVSSFDIQPAWLGQLMGVLALVAPLFLIPFAFRLAGSAIGGIHDFATKSRQRAHGAIAGNPNDKNSLRNKVQGRLRLRRAEKGVTGAAINTRLNPKYLSRGGMKRRREDLVARKSADRNILGAEYDESDAIFRANAKNDNFLLAAVRPDLAQRNLEAAEASGNTTAAAGWRQAIAGGRLVHNSPATRLNALQALSATGFQWGTGQQGYNELASTVADITGATMTKDVAGNAVGASGINAGAYVDAMNNAQFGLRSAGRYDLGGINNGEGYSIEGGVAKASGYTLGNGKIQSFWGGAEHYMGAQLTNGETAADSATLAANLHASLLAGGADAKKVGDWHAKLLDAKYSATSGNKDEINKQIDAIEKVSRDFDAGPDPTTDRELGIRTTLTAQIQKNQREQRRGIDPNLIDP